MKGGAKKMKMRNNGLGRRLRYGGVTAALTAAIIAIVIIVNIIFSALAGKLLWYTDLTPELLFTLSDNCIDLIQNGDPAFEANGSTSPIDKIDLFRDPVKLADKAETEARAKAESDGVTLTDEEIAKIREDAAATADPDIKINIIFCNTDLHWKADVTQRFVLETANQLKKEFPDYIDIEFADIVRNPTRVTKYGQSVSPTSVIIECGSEYRVRSLRSFYVFDDTADENTPWAYNGEKILAAAILAVTRASAPIAGIVTNHDEVMVSDGFLMTLVNSGYDVREINLLRDEIPADCRLLVINAPQSDFIVDEVDTVNGGVIDEIDKLDVFLDNANSMMVFMDPTLTTRLDNLEDYLEEWGVKYDRVHMGGDVYEPYKIKDESAALTVLDRYGYSFAAEKTSFGLGAEITETLGNKTIAFPGAMSISYSDLVNPNTPFHTDRDDTQSELLGYIGSVSGEAYREMYDLFVSSPNAVAEANGAEVESAASGNRFKLMTITVEDRFVQESNYTVTETPSYVIASGCPEFIANKMLYSSYGNNMFLEYTLRVLGHEPVPVGLTFKPFGDYTIDTVEADQATAYTVAFTAIPLVLAIGVGTVVIVRRKNR